MTVLTVERRFLERHLESFSDEKLGKELIVLLELEHTAAAVR